MTTPPFDDPVDLTVLGGPVRVYRAGAAGPPLLLLHGAMLDTARGVWRDVAGPLAEDHRVYAVDLPRHGASRPWRGTLDHAFLVRFLEALLDELGLDRVAVVGLSLGGGLGLGLALTRPERVSALVAVGPGGIGARRPAQLLTWALLRTPGLLRATTWWLARSPGAIRSSMRSSLTAGERTPGFGDIADLASAEARAKLEHRERALDDWQVLAYGPRRMRVDLLPELPALAVPTLWVRGADDALVSAEDMEAADAAAPGSRLVTMADAGHIVTYDRPGEFVRIVRGFLGQNPG